MKAECTWGDGPDVILSLNGTGMILFENPIIEGSGFKYGTVNAGSLDLTAQEAIILGHQLLNAAR